MTSFCETSFVAVEQLPLRFSAHMYGFALELAGLPG